MALAKREKNLIGIVIIVLAIAVGLLIGEPQFKQLQNNLSQKQQIETELQGLGLQKNALNSELQSLRASTGLTSMGLSDVTFRKVSFSEKEAVVKDILDMLIQKATANSNKLIELKPDENFGFNNGSMPQIDLQSVLNKLSSDPEMTTFTDEEKRIFAKAPTDNLTDEQITAQLSAQEYVRNNPQPYEEAYQIAVRGTFLSLQSFLEDLQAMEDIVAFRDIKLINESGADRSGIEPGVEGEDVLYDPAMPIRLLTHFTIYLDRK